MVEHKLFVGAMVEVGELVSEDAEALFAVLYDMSDKTWSVFPVADSVLGIRQSMPLRYRQYLVLDAFMYAVIGRELGPREELES